MLLIVIYVATMFARLRQRMAYRAAMSRRFRPRRGRLGEVAFVMLLGIGSAHYIMAPIVYQVNHDGEGRGDGGGDGDGDGGGDGGGGADSAPATPSK